MKVFTAIFSHYDHLRSPKIVNDAWDYTCICNPWMSVPAPWRTSVRTTIDGPRRSSRYYKILAHKTFPDTALTVWHGGNVQLIADPDRLLDIMGDKDIAIIRHPQRTSAYAEADACIRWGKGHARVIRLQMNRYRKEGFSGKPLSAAFLIVRRHTDKIAALNSLWWKEVRNGSVRDQLSFDYSCWKLGIKPAVIPGGIFRGPHFLRHDGHAK